MDASGHPADPTLAARGVSALQWVAEGENKSRRYGRAMAFIAAIQGPSAFPGCRRPVDIAKYCGLPERTFRSYLQALRVGFGLSMDHAPRASSLARCEAQAAADVETMRTPEGVAEILAREERRHLSPSMPRELFALGDGAMAAAEAQGHLKGDTYSESEYSEQHKG